jgi:hypothetical protein
MATLAGLVRAPVQRVFSRCRAYDHAGAELAELPITGGSVTADARRTRLRDARVAFGAGAGFSPSAIYDLLVTPGISLGLERGFLLADESEVFASLGRFTPAEPQLTESPSGDAAVSTSSFDFSARISRARWTDPYQIAAGTGLAEALNALLVDRWPFAVSAISSTTVTDVVGAQVVFDHGSESDPWADAVGLAADHGWALYFDTAGVARLRPAPVLDESLAAFTFAAGEASITTERTLSSPLEMTYNGVIVTGEGSDLEVPVRGEAWDSNPASPTYYLGAFGKAPLFYSSPLITTEAQAAAAAGTRLAGVIGRAENLSWSALVHPGLEPLDVVLVEEGDGTESAYILDALTIPLGASELMTATARAITKGY